MNKSAEMTKMGGIFASICAAALLDVVTAHAERITEADLLNGVLPSTTPTVSGGSVNGQYGGSYQSALGENDAQRVVFYLSKVEEGDGCCINFTLSEKSLFNTYALRVAHSGQYDTVKRGPKKWEVYGSTDNDNWVLLSSEENQTGWQFADNGGGSEYGQAASPGETRLYRFTANGKYKYIRFRFYENNGDGSYIIVTRIVLYTATAPSTGATAETFADCADLVPASTVATASRYTSTTHAANDFSAGDIATAFSDADPARVMMKNVAEGRANLVYEFGTDDKKIVNGYMLRFPNETLSDVSRAPYAWTFYGSNDGPTDAATWTALDTRTEQVGWAKDEKRYYAVTNHNAYAYYKIEFTANNGSDATDYYYEFGNIDYYYLQPQYVDFTAIDVQTSGGSLVLSGSLVGDSLPSNVSFAMVTNGVPFVCDCGMVQQGGSFSASLPATTGTYYGTLVGVSGAITNTVAVGPLYISASNTRIVSPDGNDENDGLSLEAPMLHIADAVASLGSSGGMVFVLPGTYVETNDFSAVELSDPVSVIGVTGNPADVTVRQSATYGYARVFKLTHESALVRGMTIAGGRVRNEPKEGSTVTPSTVNTSNPDGETTYANGGNIYMTAGLVENCVITNGNAARFACAGGNAWMSGGRLSRCVLVGGTANRTYCDGSNEAAGSITATGGVVENCLIKNCGGGYTVASAEGTSKFINCTVVGNTSAGCAGFVIAGNNSRVINTVIFGNSNSGYSEKPDQYPNPAENTCNIYIASKRNKLVPTDATTAFVNCATDGDTAVNASCILVGSAVFADAANGDYSPASEDSPLVNSGLDYATNGGVSLFDLVNNPRIWTRRVDIGAYEFMYKPESGFMIIVR